MTSYRSQLKNGRLYPVLVLEQVLSHRTRHGLLTLGSWLLFIFGLALIIGGLSSAITQNTLRPFAGTALLVVALWLFIELLEAYFRSVYFGSIISNRYQPDDLYTFTVGRVLYGVIDNDLTAGFCRSVIGRRIFKRVGLAPTELKEYLQTAGAIVSPRLPLRPDRLFRLQDLVKLILDHDHAFERYLLRHDIRPAELLAATAWVVREIENEAMSERWWSREHLLGLGILGVTWAYGGAYRLSRYATEIMSPRHLVTSAEPTSGFFEEVRTILSRSAEANLILVGPLGQSKTALIWELAGLVKNDPRWVAFQGRRLMVFGVGHFLASVKTTEEFEAELEAVFTDAAAAGNLILIIDSLTTLLKAAEHYQSDLANLLDDYLVSPLVPVITFAETADWHHYFERLPALLDRFERVLVPELSTERLVVWLEDYLGPLERRYGLWFTYQALGSIIEAAGQYFNEENPAGKIVDLVTEIIPWARGKKLEFITRLLVLEFVAAKTKIPIAEITKTEQAKLLHLETLLHERLIGQAAAITAISNALRRSRSGIRNLKRPIGSFLFLGPTGVGKTETAKTLAKVLFNNEEALRRLDMSEFQSPDALNRLIGSLADGTPGLLANLLREYPYAVLLLDEFEKTHPNVRNLFLQILDEGGFSDMTGKRVNARNILLIATSNAGAELIWRWLAEGKDLSASKPEIINQIIEQGIFKPELLNRFDDVIVFQPLQPEEVRAVARLLLKELADRLELKGIELPLTTALVEAVAQQGFNQQFGARPMRRFIQDTIEQHIASALIAGTLKSGSRIAFDDKLELTT